MSYLPRQEEGALVLLRRIEVSQPVGENCYVDDIAFKSEADKMVMAMQEPGGDNSMSTSTFHDSLISLDVTNKHFVLHNSCKL